MPERELRIWMRYTLARSLPARRAEMQGALTALTIARTAGNDELGLIDFMLDQKPETRKQTAEDGARAIDMMVGGKGVRKLGQKKKGGE